MLLRQKAGEVEIGTLLLNSGGPPGSAATKIQLSYTVLWLAGCLARLTAMTSNRLGKYTSSASVTDF